MLKSCFIPKVFLTGALISILLLSACSPPRLVAVEERKTINRAQEREKIGGGHVRFVQPGDTLYGIAFANGLDAQQLAAWNNVNDTSKLRIGQRIRLTRPVGFIAKPKPKTPAPISRADTRIAKSKSKQRPTPAAAVDMSKSSSALNAAAWRWPTQGPVIQLFNKSVGEQGVDISGSLGQPISASRPGEVVYVGNGLKGYGNLVILKHDEEFLSAYAHNQETFVQEGQTLAAGSRIATMGRNRNQVMLHFQIRQHGDPVDPLRYLAPR